ncbi:probable phosphorylase b kinase regulatory subunit alpha, partial [Limulus polyphemus]|uniref:Phosphorylase b kinase regulatory subunit n=1 Tax=Limulus polyphemus TaxID=6850 RepID=A0ABM1BT51_LIMPO
KKGIKLNIPNFIQTGRNKKMNLSGRQSRDVGLLSTSKLYTLQDRIFAFTPQNLDREDFYIMNDIELMANTLRSDISFLRSNWRMLGRPTVSIILHRHHMENDKIPLAMISTIKKLKSGYINGTRVSVGTLEEFLSTSCITSLSFLGNQEEGDPDSLHFMVKEYLEHELHRPLNRPSFQKGRPKRKLSMNRSRHSGISGIIKRTRSIQVDQYDSGKWSTTNDRKDDLARLQSSYDKHTRSPPVSPGAEVISVHSESSYSSPTESGEQSPSPLQGEQEEDEQWESMTRVRTTSDLQFEHVTEDELLTMLKETDNLEELGDLLHYLVVTKGLNCDTGLGHPNDHVTVKDLLKDLYEKACHEKKWALVRHIAGMLGKRVEDLPKAVTDLLVRQKQFTVGMPPFSEYTITRPLPSKELRTVINKAYREDQSTAMLTQNFCFCLGDEASEHLLNLSPYEMKTLVHHILSGKEFVVKSIRSGVVSVASSKASKKSVVDNFLGREGSNEDIHFESDRQGQWLRRRRLDGALNRVPRGFYPRIWSILERCQGLSIEGKVLSQQLTREMTPGELKFALQVEHVLNSIPQPEYRQLMVEALMVLTLVVEHDSVQDFGSTINIEHLVHKANHIFLEDQCQVDGDATLCCAVASGHKVAPCGGAAGICQHFYDSAPSGCYGTMTYMIRAVASTLDCLPPNVLDCTIS